MVSQKEVNEMVVRGKRIEMLIYKLAHALGVTFDHEKEKHDDNSKTGAVPDRPIVRK